MPSVPMIDTASGGRSEKSLSDAVFGIKPNRNLLYEAVRHFRAGQHRGTHATKNRAAVRGGGKKPWRQKGTGRARVGSTRNPLWRAGGTVFGPTPRDYGFKLNGKVTKGALRSALSLRVGEESVTVISALTMDAPSTKGLKQQLESLELYPARVLIIDKSPSEALQLSARNLGKVEVRSSGSVNAYDILHAAKVVVTEEAAASLEERLSR